MHRRWSKIAWIAWSCGHGLSFHRTGSAAPPGPGGLSLWSNKTTCECVCVYCLNSHITVFQSLDQPSKLTITSNIYYLAFGLILMNTPEQFKSRLGTFWHPTSDVFAGQQQHVLWLILFPGSSASPPSSCSVSVEWSLPLATGSATGVGTADTTAATAAGFPLVPFTSCDLVTWSGTSRDERFTYRWNPF